MDQKSIIIGPVVTVKKPTAFFASAFQAAYGIPSRKYYRRKPNRMRISLENLLSAGDCLPNLARITRSKTERDIPCL
jgi:hypothetical protein